MAAFVRSEADREMRGLLGDFRILGRSKQNNVQKKRELVSLWQQALIVKVLGRSIGYKALYTRIHQLWKPKGPLDILDLSSEYFLIQFTTANDRTNVLANGPWMIQGHYLTVRPWTPEFHPSTGSIHKLLTWVRFPELPVMYYHENVFRELASSIGTPFRVDVNTSYATHGQFARICVEVDLSKLLVGKLWFDGRCYKVVYEGLDTICFSCGIYGHSPPACPFATPTTSSLLPIPTQGEVQQEPPLQPSGIDGTDHVSDVTSPTQRFGEWMVVARRPRRPHSRSHSTTQVQGNTLREPQNRFLSLNAEISEQQEPLPGFQIGSEEIAEPSTRPTSRPYKSRAPPKSHLLFLHRKLQVVAETQLSTPTFHATHADSCNVNSLQHGPSLAPQVAVSTAMVQSFAGVLQQAFSQSPSPTEHAGIQPQPLGAAQIIDEHSGLSTLARIPVEGAVMTSFDQQQRLTGMDVDPSQVFEHEPTPGMAMEVVGAPQEGGSAQ
ncbi:hypothetical protein K2173_022615 [Erythroxylum novogranatense]|uniref:DUF4283 domain-containing protein n=1 Tax=Erythroxylum novogranatense TaxID=1862640 RepID=A0AAV8TQX1_9ROSI|nr:hypothetical protein K2173_022615 [Erythroxylum novogranatense]